MAPNSRQDWFQYSWSNPISGSRVHHFVAHLLPDDAYPTSAITLSSETADLPFFVFFLLFVFLLFFLWWPHRITSNDRNHDTQGICRQKRRCRYLDNPIWRSVVVTAVLVVRRRSLLRCWSNFQSFLRHVAKIDVCTRVREFLFSVISVFLFAGVFCFLRVSLTLMFFRGDEGACHAKATPRTSLYYDKLWSPKRPLHFSYIPSDYCSCHHLLFSYRSILHCVLFLYVALPSGVFKVL